MKLAQDSLVVVDDNIRSVVHQGMLSFQANQLLEVYASERQKIKHGDLPRWEKALRNMPSADNTTDAAFSAKDGKVVVETSSHPVRFDSSQIRLQLQELIPWRKGPFSLFGVDIDAEWKSNLKWERIKVSLPSLRNKRILDAGCGNGYYMFRMLEHKPSLCIGVDPTLLYHAQFAAVSKYCDSDIICMLPLRTEQIPEQLSCFDVVFCMGVLYHRKDPHAHLKHLLSLLDAGGELVLETLIVGDEHASGIYPPERYANMRNVWFLPTAAIVLEWLHEAGFVRCSVTTTSYTSTDEQRTTEWMPFHSLKEALDLADATKTRENLPAPCRAIFRAARDIAA